MANTTSSVALTPIPGMSAYQCLVEDPQSKFFTVGQRHGGMTGSKTALQRLEKAKLGSGTGMMQVIVVTAVGLAVKS